MKKLYPAYIYLLTFVFVAMSALQVRAQLPTEFQKVDLLTGLANATTMQFAPDGRIFILDRYGEVIIFKTDTQTKVSAGSIPVYHEHEDGLLGITFDPDFLNNNYIYLSYSPESSVVNRVSRFTMSGDNLNLTSEQILMEWPTSRTALWHSGGDMGFDSQGNLLISTGDNATYDNLKYAPLDETNADFSAEKSSSNTNDLRGKILRITPSPGGSYTIPIGNLFTAGTADARPEIYVMGARNPYRIFVDKQNTDWLFWGEVGPDANVASELGPEGRDEINLTKTAGNYGWPYFSGTDNAAYQIRYADPTYYNDPANPQNISVWNTGLTELPPAREAWLEFFHKSYFAGPRYYYDANLNDEQRFPAAFDGIFFYYDFNSSKIWTVRMDAQGNIIENNPFAESVFPTTRDGFIDMEMGPDGKMYILAYGTGCCPQNVGTGRLVRVDYTGITTNAPPAVMISADKNNGSLPLTVNFSSEGTSDPNDDSPLSFSWDFDGDGNSDSDLQNPSFVYNNPGVFDVQLRVDDGNGGVGVNNLTIYAGNNAANFSFDSPIDGGLIDWNDTVDINLTVTDVEDGAIDCNDVNLAPGLGHVNHSHPDATQNGCPKTLTVVPTGHNEQGGDDVFYVLNAEYTDRGGLQAFEQIILHPKRKEAEFFDTQNGTTVIDNTDPLEGGIQALQVDNNAFISYSGRNLTNITGVKYKIAAPTAGGTIELRVGSATGTLLATTSVPATGAFDTWEAVTSNFVPPAGKNDIFVVFRSTAGPEDIFNINYVEFLGAGVGETDSNITITSPSNGWDVNQAFEVAFRIENLKSEQGNGNLHFTIDGGTLQEHEGYGPIPIDGLALGNHTIRLELYNPDDTPSGIFDEVTINVTDDISCNDTPFPDSWAVHELEENPYTAVYTFADDDLDGDGLKDIVTGGWWYKNPGTASGNWVKNTIGGSFGNVAHVYDFDGDGDMDLLGTTGRYTNAILVWAQNDGAGNFSIFDNIPAGDTDYREPFLAGLAGGVFDVDGPYQMAINWNGAEETNSPVQMLTPSENPTTGTWTLEDISQDSSGEDIQAGDIDGDGDLDLFQGINWLRNNGNGSFETFDTGITYASTPDRAQLADFDRDGDLDAVVGQLSLGGTGNNTEFSWFAAPADPTQPWVRNVLDGDINGSLSVFAIDIDFDGDKDIVVGEWRGANRLIAFDNDLCGSGEFNLRVIDDGSLNLEHHDGARVTDIDNDGDLDIISNGWLNDLVPRIYENTTIPPSDARPIAIAGDDRTVLPGTEFILTGSGSDPDGGEIAAYLWSKQSSPEGDTATLSGADTTEVTVNNAIEGTYVFRLTVTDDEGDRGFDEVTITVGTETPTEGNVTRINAGGPAFTFEGDDWAVDQYANGGDTIINTTPIANTTNDQLYQTERYRTGGSLIYEIPVANGEHSVNLHFAEIYFGLPGGGSAGGAGSRVFNIDVEGQGLIENYDIFLAAGGAATAVIENFTGINVTDESLTITLTQVTEFPKISGIEIIEPSTTGAPVADAGADQEIILPVNSVVLTGSGTDADGGEVSYAWTQQSGPEAALNGADTSELSVSNLLTGAYVFRLTVTDDEGETDFDEVSVMVLPEGGILAVAEAAPMNGSAPLEVTFTGSNSMGEITGYLWDFKDGNTSTEADPANTFIADGTYDVELTVTDAGGMTNTATISIVVSETGTGDVMGVFLEQNPPKDGMAIIRVINQPDNFMMLGVNVHDIQGRLLNSYKPDEISVDGDTYQVPVHILRAGLYFFEIAMNQGKPVTLKLLVRK